MLRTPALRGGILTESYLHTMRLPYARFKESHFLRVVSVKNYCGKNKIRFLFLQPYRWGTSFNKHHRERFKP